MNTRRLFASAVLLLLASSSLLAAAPAPDPTYTALRAARPDGRVIAVNNFEFDRDVYHFTLNGSLYLLAPVDKTDVGCVFVGEGTYTLTPATPVEQRQLAINSGDEKLKVLTEKFTSGVFFDSQLIAKAGVRTRATVAPEANKTLDDFLKYERKELKTNVHIRVLQDVQDPSDPPLFLAYIRGKKYPPSILAVDPRGVDALGLHVDDGGEKTLFLNVDQTTGGFWYLAFQKSEIASGKAAHVTRPADAELYAIDTTIAPNAEVSGKTTMTLTAKNTFTSSAVAHREAADRRRFVLARGRESAAVDEPRVHPGESRRGRRLGGDLSDHRQGRRQTAPSRDVSRRRQARAWRKRATGTTPSGRARAGTRMSATS